jgi:histone-lysine N-methyltransferase SETMAR
MVEFMQQGTALTSEVCCETLNKLRRAIENKRCGMLTPSLVLLHDSVHPRTAARTRALPGHFNWELFDHPPYNPDLTPSDYHQFTHLKNWL